MADHHQDLFRKETMDRISSPEQLKDYLRVTNPGIWTVLIAVILLLAGLLAWSAAGTLETRTDVKVIVENQSAEVVPVGSEILEAGMSLSVSGQDYLLSSANQDIYGRSIGKAHVEMPDGVYDGTVVTEEVHPIEFLLKSR